MDALQLHLGLGAWLLLFGYWAINCHAVRFSRGVWRCVVFIVYAYIVCIMLFKDVFSCHVIKVTELVMVYSNRLQDRK